MPDRTQFILHQLPNIAIRLTLAVLWTSGRDHSQPRGRLHAVTDDTVIYLPVYSRIAVTSYEGLEFLRDYDERVIDGHVRDTEQHVYYYKESGQMYLRVASWDQCPPITLNGEQIPHSDAAKYLVWPTGIIRSCRRVYTLHNGQVNKLDLVLNVRYRLYPHMSRCDSRVADTPTASQESCIQFQEIRIKTFHCLAYDCPPSFLAESSRPRRIPQGLNSHIHLPYYECYAAENRIQIGLRSSVDVVAPPQSVKRQWLRR
ncbi:hypothetical protein EVAR_6276_1 [Eumeta japonica]|uniref:Uncharacterized protein n=1 Tax=Eumeta variegata TaxID=151549 RepID=A0A4C1TBD1_EUMVA|nr:hypothetical protein EVAR_6276_1 [Eumeta japonica]